MIFHLAKRLPEAEFLLIGGNEKAIRHYKSLAIRRGLKNVNFAGFISNSLLPLYLAACDVLLMPYQRKVEISGGGDTSEWMSPMKMFEYMAAGRAIVSSDLPVLREVLNDCNSVLCNPEDFDAWKDSIEGLLKNGQKRLEIGSEARKDAEGYSWRKRVLKIMNFKKS